MRRARALIGIITATLAFTTLPVGPAAAAPITTRVSVSSGGQQGNAESGEFYRPAVSSTGRYVAFASSATNLVAGDTNGERDVFVRDRQTGATTRVSVGAAGVQANSRSFEPAISSTGRFVVFASFAPNLVPGDTSNLDVFLRDRQTGVTQRVSVDTGGGPTNGLSGSPAVSADGRFVVFESSASDLVVGDTNGEDDVFIRDRQAGLTERVSVRSGGQQANNGSFSYDPKVSNDGRYVVFNSSATNTGGR